MSFPTRRATASRRRRDSNLNAEIAKRAAIVKCQDASPELKATAQKEMDAMLDTLERRLLADVGL